MRQFKDLKKAAKTTVEGKEFRLAVLGNSATQFFSAAVQGLAKLEGVNLNLYDADYNQIDAQLLDNNSETCLFKPDAVLLYLATDKLYEEYMDLPHEAKSSFAQDTMEKIKGYWNLASQNVGARILQMNFTEIDDKVFGSYGCKVADSFVFQLRKLNYLLDEEASRRRDVYPIDALAVQIALGKDAFYDAALYYNAKMCVSMNALPALAKAVVDVLKCLVGSIKKCVICDLDNTLWGGVIGDDGMAGIEIGELGRGHAFTDLQRYLKQLKERGIILAVCSKNDEKIAKEPFESHDEMVLRLSDISAFVANWNDKASNIKFIQETLNIGMDSMVFLDDNPFERNLVRSMIPQIAVPELPEDPALYLSFLQAQNYFETASYSSEDSNRTGQYQAEFERKKAENSFSNIEDYLKSLEMVGEANPFDEARFPRIAQLTQRSNQFNLRTVRYTEDQIASIAGDKKYITRYYTLKDKFGDHGLVSVVIMEKTSDDEAFVDTWLMSCRVLKRGMEEFVINQAVEAARSQGVKTLRAEYIATPKNAMVKDIYKNMGFAECGEGKYSLDVESYKVQKTYISLK